MLDRLPGLQIDLPDHVGATGERRREAVMARSNAELRGRVQRRVAVANRAARLRLPLVRDHGARRIRRDLEARHGGLEGLRVTLELCALLRVDLLLAFGEVLLEGGERFPVALELESGNAQVAEDLPGR